MIEDQDRGTGRTTKQILESPYMGTFVCADPEIRYIKELIRHLGRTDLKVRGLNSIFGDTHGWQANLNLVIDHYIEEIEETFSPRILNSYMEYLQWKKSHE